MMERFHICFNFAFKFNLRHYNSRVLVQSVVCVGTGTRGTGMTERACTRPLFQLNLSRLCLKITLITPYYPITPPTYTLNNP
jgi:hypothetical protein